MINFNDIKESHKMNFLKAESTHDKQISNKTIRIYNIDQYIITNMYLTIAWKESICMCVCVHMHTLVNIEGASASNTIGLGVSGQEKVDGRRANSQTNLRLVHTAGASWLLLLHLCHKQSKLEPPNAQGNPWPSTARENQASHTVAMLRQE